MSSYRHRSSVPNVPLRSSKIPSSATALRLGSRPRSYGLYSSGSTPSIFKPHHHGAKASSFLSSLSPAGYLANKTSTYGGTTSGYGGLTLHHSPVSSSISLSSSPSTSALLLSNSHRLSPRNSPARVPLPAKSHSFNTGRNLASLRSSLGSLSTSGRSSSLISLSSTKSAGSEGYASDWSGRSSRLNSTVGAGGDSTASSRATTPARNREEAAENGEPDYKRLYEESQLENERLREMLKKTEGELLESKSQIEKTSHSTKMSLSELEKRERRSLERKLAEMEEELKQLQKLKAENERLKAENRALTRVVSKLTNSPNATK